MAEPKRVVVLGDIQPDISFRLPLPGEVAHRDRHGPVVSGGGTAANTAATLGRLGVDVSFIGSVGNDPFGRMVVAELAAGGVETGGCIFTDAAPTPVVFALAQPDGDTALYRWPPDAGADWSLSWERIDSERIRRAAWLHTTGICLRHSPAREAVLAAMCVAREAGVPVSFDLNFRSEQRTDDAGLHSAFTAAIAHASVLLGHGEDEIMRFSGVGELESAMRLIRREAQTVIARLGGRGVSVLSPDGGWRAEAYPTTLISSVGAGDAFNGGFIAASIAGHDLNTAVRWGQAVAALKISKGGARALPDRSELTQFLAERASSTP